MHGDTLSWFKWMSQNNQLGSWEVFVRAPFWAVVLQKSLGSTVRVEANKILA
ncbi:hypothetical protein Scep_017123 [Stephania cephalantha]|uniref:Uncharacterized protein n=1 Tax=Stephania cephalantha TaxID=152367 RepID=A0AAP0IPG7_9MAGN